MATRVGTRLDRYEIVAEIGRGAMGVVYRARDPKLDRTVAIKTVSISGLEPDAEQEYRQRFVVEARAAGRLSHSGIVTVFDVREEAEPYLVMEFVDGQSLQQLVSQDHRALPLSSALRLIQEIAEALHYAHTQGVIHRDIKPANILVTPDGHPKIADFGIAKLNQSELTLAGQVLGSPAFMAPEQLSDEGVDPRSDLFSLGVILYYVLTGHRPFQGNSTTTVCFKLANHEPLHVSAFDSKFPPELDKIVSRAIAKDPAQRYQSGAAMASDIQALRESSRLVPSEVEWTARTLTHDAIPPYMAGSAEHRSPEREPANQRMALVTAGSGRAIEGNENVSNEKASFSWKLLLICSLFAIATGFVTVRSLRRTGPEPNVQSNMDPSLRSSSIVVGNPGNREQTTAKQPEPLQELSQAGPKVQLPPNNIPVATTPGNATLRIEIEHHFTSALAWVWLDRSLVYQRSLLGRTSRQALLFRKVSGHQFEAIRVSGGRHRLRVRIQSPTESYDESKTLADAVVRSESTLRIVCKRSQLQLTLQ